MSARLRELASYARFPGALTGGSGSFLHTGGRSVLDLYGGHCVNTLGMGHPGVGAALQRQWQELSFVSNAGAHAGRAAFLEALGPSMPPGSWSVFCSNSGAEANENLLKAAFAATGRSVAVVAEGAFHGRTAGVAPLSAHAGACWPAAPATVRTLAWNDAEAVGPVVTEDVAAVLLEPVQSLAGVRVANAAFLEALRARCTETGAWLLFDEVQTGNGRLGASWASQALGVVPDGFSTAKGVAAGLPLGLSVFAEERAASFAPGLLGSTFGGSPLALAAAAAVARIVHQPAFLTGVRARGEQLADRARALPGVAGVRGLGLLLGVELEAGLEAAPMRDALLDQGVLVGTTWDPQVLRFLPALDLPGSAADFLARAWHRAHARIPSPTA